MLKRALDVLLSAFSLIVLSPLLVSVAIVLRFTGEGEIFYLQERIGRGRRPFKIVKFATMLKNSPNLLGGDVTVGNDPRVLPVGRFLRQTKINELPQLYNVFVGDMSIIGPRPLTPRVYAPFPESYKIAIEDLRPGLSGIGSVVFRDEEKLFPEGIDRENFYVETITPYKAAIEEWYAQRASLLLDIKLVILTVLAVLKPDIDTRSYFSDLPLPPAALVLKRK
jgi:lipopolysaccharide/colanic/teichoic acid biosynthesis glycosyltransferase